MLTLTFTKIFTKVNILLIWRKRWTEYGALVFLVTLRLRKTASQLMLATVVITEQRSCQQTHS